MEVRPGYKQTEVGVIPEDWEAVDYVAFGQIIDGDRGVHYPGVGDLRDTGYCLFLNAGNVTNRGFRFSECQFISAEKDRKLNKGKLTRGDVVLTTRGTLGNFAYFNDDVPYEHVRINSGMVILRNTSPTVSNAYQYLVLLSRVVASQIERLSFGSAQPQLTVKGISTFKIPLPPTKAEQEAIAEALSDADARIESLEQLLAKKRDLKQGAMQQLLTGKKRLPGFSGEWDEMAIGALCHVEEGEITGGGNTNYLEIGDIDISSKTYGISGKEKLSVPGSVKVPAGTLLISTVRPTRGAITVTRETTYVSSAFCRLSIKNSFMFYVVCQNRFLTYLGENSKGGTYPTCRTEDILRYRCSAPRVPAEQAAIAAILSDMDGEIAALEAKLAKARQLKQGMMQELLTGKVRLV